MCPNRKWKTTRVKTENGKPHGVTIENGKPRGVNIENGKPRGVKIENGKPPGDKRQPLPGFAVLTSPESPCCQERVHYACRLYCSHFSDTSHKPCLSVPCVAFQVRREVTAAVDKGFRGEIIDILDWLRFKVSRALPQTAPQFDLVHLHYVALPSAHTASLKHRLIDT